MPEEVHPKLRFLHEQAERRVRWDCAMRDLGFGAILLSSGYLAMSFAANSVSYSISSGVALLLSGAGTYRAIRRRPQHEEELRQINMLSNYEKEMDQRKPPLGSNPDEPPPVEY